MTPEVKTASEDAHPADLERFKQWLSFAKFLLGTFALGLITLLVNHQIQERELEMKEQEEMGHFLGQALTEEVGVRRRLAQYFASVTRSEAMRTRWQAYLTIVDKEYSQTQDALKSAVLDVQKTLTTTAPAGDTAGGATSFLLERKLAEVDELSAALKPKPSQRSVDVTPRVYIHIRKNSQREGATALGDSLAASMGVIVPGVQLVSGVPKHSELRYFSALDRDEAGTIVDSLKSRVPDLEASYVSGYEHSAAVRPHHYELWLAELWAPAKDAAGSAVREDPR
jgi:hypothetical protein